MTGVDSNSRGFSRGQRWLTMFNLSVATLALLAVMVMVNYVAQGHSRRYQIANYTNFKLSAQTLRVLHSLTNDVKATIFYERSDPGDVYAMICGLLAEYQNASKHIHVVALDYTSSPGEANLFRERLHLTGANERDFVAFESNGRSKICKGTELSNYDIQALLSGQKQEIRRTEFLGEAKFTDLIFAVSYPRPMKAYFLMGHGERDPEDPADKPKPDGPGISKLAAILKDEIDCDWQTLTLAGTNPIPQYCDLLIVATPRGEHSKLSSNELTQIQTYLKKDNGRLLALLDSTEGLDPILAEPWGANRPGAAPVVDLDAKARTGPFTFLGAVAADQTKQIHPIVKPLASEGLRIQMILPQPIFRSELASRGPGAPTMTPLVATSTNAVEVGLTSSNTLAPLHENRGAISLPLVVAIEQGVITGGDGTRIVLAGDADFLDDQYIDTMANHFLGRQILNWLLHRNEIALEGLGPLPIKEYRLMMTDAQTRQLEWLFLGAMPGAVLLLGGLVWLRRRS